MRVLVTGGAGFLGSHVVEVLLAAGHEVTVLDNLVTGSRSNLSPKAAFVNGDVRESLTTLFIEVRPEIVVHLAAQVSVPLSVAEPYLDLTVNAGGTINVMQAAAAAKTKKVIAVSSAAVYGTPEVVPIREEMPVRAISPYGLSKIVEEQYVRLLGRIHGIAHTILRPSNIYGPRQTTKGEGAVVPSFLTRFLAGIDPVIHGNGEQTRDFIYVSDMARAILLAIDHGDGLTLNISGGQPVTIFELWANLSAILGWKHAPVYGTVRVGDIPHSVLSNIKARTHLGWQPLVPIEEGLLHTVQWMRFQESLRPTSRHDLSTTSVMDYERKV